MLEKTIKFFKKIFLFSFVFFSYNQMSYSQDVIWEKTEGFNKSVLANVKLNSSVYNLKVYNFEQKLNRISENKTEMLYFPVGQRGEVLKFMVKETKVLHPNLARKFPNIKSYKGVTLDGLKRTIRFTYSSDNGFVGVFENTIHEKVEIKPINKLLHEFINTSSQVDNSLFECQTESLARKQMTSFGAFDRDIDDGNLRRYRLALSVSGDYSQVFLDGTETDDKEQKAKVLQAMVNSVNRLNGIFERDFGVTMQLIDNTDLLIFLDPLTDPYFLGENLREALVNTIGSTISDSDYDVGHLFHKESNAIYGNAGCIACVCTDGEKGQAYSVHSNPDTDDMNLLAAHEFGHQFGAYHTQSSGNCRSGINSEVEPGSGSTIMSYAGICSPNVQAGADDYFNYTSIRDVANWTINNSSCAELIPTGNSAPIVSQGLDYIIPKNTPFVLEGNATDSDGNDMLTYCWEQNDPEDPQDINTPSSTRLLGPMFRSFPPSSSSKRYFPKLSDIVDNNLTPTWEVLPSVSRDLNFVFTVRDNDINGGQVTSDAVKIKVDDNFGPFVVTSQQDDIEVWTVGEDVTVTWDVAGTDLSPINVSEIEILLSLDAGETFSTTLITTANDGEETFSLPDVDATTEARIMIKAVDNVFFALNQEGFSIQKSEYAIFSEAASINVCNSENAVFNLEYKTFLAFDEAVNLAVSNLPEGVNASFTDDTFSGSNLSGIPFVITLTNIGSLDLGSYTFNVDGLSVSGVEKSIALNFTVFSVNNTSLKLVSPVNNSDSQEIDIEFSWIGDDNSVSYDLEVATDDAFTNVIDNVSTKSTIYKSSSIENNNKYYWRVKSSNPCNDSNYSEVYSFSTQCSTPENFTVVNIGFDEIEVSWDDSPTNESWTIEYGLTGFVLGEGVISNLTLKEFKAELLNSGTLYDFYIKGNCSIGGASSNIGPFTVSTKYDYCSGDHFYDTGGANGVYQNNEYITTQIYPETNEKRVRVSFNNFNIESYRDFIYVFDGESSNDNYLGSYTGTELQGREFTSKHESGALTFIFISNGGTTASGWDATVFCEDKPNCLEPTNFRNTVLTGEEATFEWESVADNANWVIEYELSGFSKGTGVFVDVSEPLVTLSNLKSLTTYDVYIKTVCDAGGFSDSIGPYTFTTTELCTIPSNFNLIAVERDSVELIWDDNNGGATEWEIVYGTGYFDPDNIGGTVVTSFTNSISINNLLINTQYYVAIRSNCEEDGYSNWSNSLFFKTKEACKIPYLSLQEITKTTAEVFLYNDEDITDWEIEYSEYYFTPGTGIGEVMTSTSNSINLENLSPETNYYIYARSNCGAYGYSEWSYINSFTTEAICVAPNGFIIENITTSSVDLQWDNNGGNITEWEIEYSVSYFSPGTGVGTLITSSTNSINIDGLMQGTGYYFYVRSNCEADGYSDWTGSSFYTQVSCYTPGGVRVQSVTKNSVDLNWFSQDVNEWEIEYKEGGFTPGIGEGTVVTSVMNSVTIENLLPNTYYNAYVRSNCGENGYSKWSYSSSFRTQEACNSVGGFNVRAVTKNAAELFWNIDDNVTEWQIEYKANYFTPGNGDGTLVTSSTNSINLENLLSSTYYYVYVRGNCGVDGYSDWSYYRTFRTSDLCSMPQGITTQNVTKNSFELIWNNNDADEWEIEYSANYFTPGTGTALEARSTINSINLENLLPATYYYIAIRSNCSTDGYSDWYWGLSFRTEDACKRPVGFRIQEVTTSTAELLWDNEDDVAEWEIEYKETYFTPGTGEGVLVTSSTNSIVLEELLQDASYYVYIRSDCNLDGYSNWSSLSFSTETMCSVPFGLGVQTVTKNSAELSWYDSGDISEWEVIYKSDYFDPNDGTGTVVKSTTNSINLENLLPATYYYVYLRSNCGTDGYSNWSYYMYFRTEEACLRPYISTIQNVTNDMAELLWENNNSVTEWEIEYKSSYFNPGNGEGTLVTSVQNSINLENLLPATYYYVYLRSNCGVDGYSDWSGYFTFITDVNCGIPKNVTASNVTKSSIDLIWLADDSVAEWEVEYSENSFSPGMGTGTLEVTTTNLIAIDNLITNSWYYVYIRKKCEAGGYSEWTAQERFKTSGDYCGGDHFYDSGGVSGNYLNGENITTVIAPESINERVKVVFNSFAVESCCDRLKVYDGPDVLSPLIATFSYKPTAPLVSSHESGSLTFVFTSDGSSTRSGWDASVVCETIPVCSAPINFVNVDVSGVEAGFSWEHSDTENGWTLEYGLEGFSLGSGTKITSNVANAIIKGLNPNTSYDIYLKTNCEFGRFSEIVGPLNFETYCNTTQVNNEYVVNGSFECGSLEGWVLEGTNSTYGCGSSFSVLRNSNSVCTNDVEEIAPTNGNYAAYTSFEGDANTSYRLSQTIVIPENIDSANKAILSFNFKVNYRMIFNNPSQEKVFTVRFTDLLGAELFKVDEVRFGLSPSRGSIDTAFSKDVLSELMDYAGESIMINFEAFVPESNTGPSKALVDNVSLYIDNVLSIEAEQMLDSKLIIYPVPNDGAFTIENRNGGGIDLVEIFDVSGRLIQTKRIKSPSNKIDVNLRSVNSGVYFVKVRVSGTRLTRRIVVE